MDLEVGVGLGVEAGCTCEIIESGLITITQQFVHHLHPTATAKQT